MENVTITSVLKWIFTYILYPGVILGVFVYVIVTIGEIVEQGKGPAVARRLAGAHLPAISLVFLVVSEGQDKDSLGKLFSEWSPYLRFGVGLAVGISLMEFGRFCMTPDAEIGSVVYACFLSSVASFLIYCIMRGSLANIQLLLFGFIIGGGLHVMFRTPFKSQ